MPRRKTAAIGVKLSPELKAKVDAVCKAEFRSVAGLVEMLLTQYVEARPHAASPLPASSPPARPKRR
jgi:hypothetical protein